MRGRITNKTKDRAEISSNLGRTYVVLQEDCPCFGDLRCNSEVEFEATGCQLRPQSREDIREQLTRPPKEFARDVHIRKKTVPET